MLNRTWWLCDKIKLWDVYNEIDDHFEYRMPRAMLQAIKASGMKDLVGVEIGTQRGVNAFGMMRTLPMKKLYLIDPYMFYDYEGRSSNAVDPEPLQNEFYKDARKTLRRYGNKVQFIVKKSEDAIDDIPNNVDFIYIDGNHDYPFIKKDIELYYPKVKVGGFFGGHDIHLHDVFKAVSEFRKNGDKEIHIKRVDWWFIKK